MLATVSPPPHLQLLHLNYLITFEGLLVILDHESRRLLVLPKKKSAQHEQVVCTDTLHFNPYDVNLS